MDAGEIHAKSLKGWSGVAEAWLEYAPVIRTKFSVVSDWMLAQLRPEEAAAVLELACGAGDLTVQIAEHMGPGATLVASDFSPEMVAATEKQFAAAGVDADLRVLDAQALDLPDGSFDACACRFGYMLMPEPDKALAETHRVLRDRGRAVAAVWGALERNAWLMVFGMALMQSGEMGSPDGEDPYGPGGVFSLSDPSTLRAKFEGAGFTDVVIEEISFTYDFADFDTFWTMQSQVSGGAAQRLAELPPAQRDAIKDTARGLAESFVNESGYSFPALALGISAGRD